MIAIKTHKFCNVNGSDRIRATATINGRRVQVSIGYDYGRNAPNNHDVAAHALANKFGYSVINTGSVTHPAGYTFIGMKVTA